MAPRKGNTNALKHGLYAQRFTDIEKTNLGKMPTDDLRQEIAMLRVIADRIFGLLTNAPKEDASAEEKQLHSDSAAKLTNSLTSAITALNSTIRTHAILNGSYNPINDALLEALTRVPPYEDDERPH